MLISSVPCTRRLAWPAFGWLPVKCPWTSWEYQKRNCSTGWKSEAWQPTWRLQARVELICSSDFRYGILDCKGYQQTCRYSDKTQSRGDSLVGSPFFL